MNIIDRKIQLFLRDPLKNEFDKEFHSWLRNQVGIERDAFKLPEFLEIIINKIWEKWKLVIIIPLDTYAGLFDQYFITGVLYEKVKDGRGSWVFPEIRNNIFFYPHLNYPPYIVSNENLIYCSPPKIPIIIDLSLITLNDAKEIKKATWEIVENELRKLRTPQEQEGWHPSLPEKEPPELAKALRCREKTFINYLRWYDQKMAGLTFRLIALIDSKSQDIEKKEKKTKEIISLRKMPRIGQSVKGESNVRNGFKIIYQAIYRETAPPQEETIKTLEKYECPEHGSDCDWECNYVKDWKADFERSHKDAYRRESLYPRHQET